MPNQQIEWISEAAEPQRSYRSMVVGWQTLLSSLNATVLAFNNEYLGAPRDNADVMKEIALKRLAVASLYEVHDRLEAWYARLRELGALSPESEALKREVRPLMRHAEHFAGVRHLTFHYGDPVEPVDALLALYRAIELLDLNEVNAVLRGLVGLGERLKQDALARAD